MVKTITLNGKTYEVIDQWAEEHTDKVDNVIHLQIKELPSPPKEEFPKVFNINESFRIDILKDGKMYFVLDGEYQFSLLSGDYDINALKQAVDCAEKIREGMK